MDKLKGKDEPPQLTNAIITVRVLQSVFNISYNFRLNRFKDLIFRL